MSAGVTTSAVQADTGTTPTEATGAALVRQRRGVDLSLYLVTDTRLCAGIGVPATVAAAVRAGVTVVQVRDPHASDAELVALGRAVRAELAGTGVPLIVNDRWHLVAEIGADGAHVGQHDDDPRTVRTALGPTALLGLSVQLPAHVADARAWGDDVVDHLGVGPVWDQWVKPDAAPPIGVAGFRAVAEVSPWPCVAIGGVQADGVPALRAAGAAGVAVVSAICGTPDVAAATRRLRAAWDGAEGAGPSSAAGAPGAAGVSAAVGYTDGGGR